jgi:carbamate kinase
MNEYTLFPRLLWCRYSGAIGYMFTMALDNEFKERGLKKHAVAVVTQTVVDKNDKAFQNPSKPIGSFMDEKTAKAHSEADNDSG